jgi:hypothetical protein
MEQEQWWEGEERDGRIERFVKQYLLALDSVPAPDRISEHEVQASHRRIEFMSFIKHSATVIGPSSLLIISL